MGTVAILSVSVSVNALQDRWWMGSELILQMHWIFSELGVRIGSWNQARVTRRHSPIATRAGHVNIDVKLDVICKYLEITYLLLHSSCTRWLCKQNGKALSLHYFNFCLPNDNNNDFPLQIILFWNYLTITLAHMSTIYFLFPFQFILHRFCVSENFWIYRIMKNQLWAINANPGILLINTKVMYTYYTLTTKLNSRISILLEG